MDAKTYTELETAAFDAWPALVPDEMFMGWRLRFSGGSTKRTNSANSTVEAADLGRDEIEHIEHRYRERGLPTVFRITSVAAPARIDDALGERGYQHVDPTWVMTMPLRKAVSGNEPLRLLDAESWVDCYQKIAHAQAERQLSLMKLIQSRNEASAFAVELCDGVPACCGIGVVSKRKVGLFAVATAPEYLREGLAAGLCSKLLAWGQQRGAREGYLQVVRANVGAVSLYQKLGFSPAYRYWYRIHS